MGMALLGAFLVYGTLEPGAIVAAQGARTRCAAGASSRSRSASLLFFTAAIAETKRTPFDIPEGEPEIIGYFVEYSGMRFGMFFLAEFIEIVFIAAIMVDACSSAAGSCRASTPTASSAAAAAAARRWSCCSRRSRVGRQGRSSSAGSSC